MVSASHLPTLLIFIIPPHTLITLTDGPLEGYVLQQPHIRQASDVDALSHRSIRTHKPVYT